MQSWNLSDAWSIISFGKRTYIVITLHNFSICQLGTVEDIATQEFRVKEINKTVRKSNF